MNIEIVTIGDELLLGFTVDTNAAVIARALSEIGVAIVRRTTVGDVEADIVRAVEDALSRADGVLTTGGLGPTSDDRSRPAVARVFGRAMVLHEPTLAAVRERWKRRGWKGEMPETNRDQAMVPEGATLLANNHGSAPGIWLDNAEGKWVAMLPGVPREMRGMLNDELIPRLRARVGNATVVASRTVRTTGVPESRIADLVQSVQLPDGVDLAYLPNWEGVDLRVTVRDVPPDVAQARIAAAARALSAPLSDCVYGENGADLASVVLDALRARAWTVAVAESCTGGMLGARLTAIAGSSDVVRGGVIAYDNGVKESHLAVRAETLAAHGAVSEGVAREMAAGVRAALKSSVGVAITGVAGPSGGTAEKPVGTVCIAVATPDGAVAATNRHVGDRDEVRKRSTQAALMLLRAELV
ncbi:MAG TPA: competence/damage-inducible protein A [Gemmatimonadaceae bacterium]|nr:competence/damage-inducible protein A [Gemmatimonadaceae bacterium]